MGNRTTFFTVDRKLLTSELWLSEPFSRGQAWLDLIGRANYADSENCQRGQVFITERQLAERWKWSRGKVQSFFRELEEAGRISRKAVEIQKSAQKSTSQSAQKSTIGTLVTIEKYDVFQLGDNSQKSAQKSTSQSGQKATIKEYIYKNINNLLYMAEEEERDLREQYGEDFEPLRDDVLRYYEQRPDKTFPGWSNALAQFKANQTRWNAKKKRGSALGDLFAQFDREVEK